MKDIHMLFLFCLMFFSAQAVPKIHVFGDSHASYCFTNEQPLQLIEQSIYHHQLANGYIFPIQFIIHWFKEVTMHRVGRDGFKCINLRNEKVPEKSIVVFVFGEIDIRCHLGKQADRQQKPIDFIVTDVVERYINTIKLNCDLYKALTIVICGPMPPANYTFNAQFYPYGTLEERIAITLLMRQKLISSCKQNNFLYLDVYDLYCTLKGDLSTEMYDGIVHVKPCYNGAIKERLVNLLHRAQITDFANI